MTISLEMDKPNCVLLLIHVSFFSLVSAEENACTSLDSSKVGRVMARQTCLNNSKGCLSTTATSPGYSVFAVVTPIYAITHLCPGLRCPEQSSNQETGRKGRWDLSFPAQRETRWRIYLEIRFCAYWTLTGSPGTTDCNAKLFSAILWLE